MRRVVAVAIAVLLLPSVGAAWTTYQGDAARSGVAALEDHPYDVVSAFNVDVQVAGVSIANLVETPHGIFGIHQIAAVDQEEDICSLFRLSQISADSFEHLDVQWECVPYTGATSGTLSGVGRPTMAAYSPMHDVLLACIPLTLPTPVLYAIHAETLEVVWSIAPPGYQGDEEGQTLAGTWSCNGVALDESTDEAVVVFQAIEGGQHRIASIRLSDGSTNWATSSAAFSLVGQHEGDSNVLAQQGEAYWGSPYNTQTASFGIPGLVETGMVIPVLVANTATQFSANNVQGAVWLNRDGNLVGKTWDITPYTQDPNPPAGTSSISVAGSGNQIAALVANTIYIVQPDVQTAVVIPTDHDLGGGRWTVPPCWHENWLFVPLEHHGWIVDPDGVRETIDWPGLNGGEIQQCIMNTDATVFVLVSREQGENDSHDLLKLDLRTGLIIHQTPLPLSGNGLGFDSHIMPVDVDGHTTLLAWDRFGYFALLGESDRDLQPVLELDALYPSFEDTVTLTLDAGENVARHEIAWGDGGLTTLNAGRFDATHEYLKEGTYDIHVTRVFTDGTTATASTQVHYGLDDLNWVQEQFAKENQDRTYGVLGILLALFGAVVAILTRYLGRSRIRRGLEELETIRQKGNVELLPALADLQNWHHDQQRLLLKGRLTEDQFRVLEGRGARLLRQLARRAMEPFADDISKRFGRELETSFLDGFVDAGEVGQLRSAARGEKLSGRKRKALDALLDAWS